MTDKYILRELCRYSLGTFADIIYRNALLHSRDEAFVWGPQRITFGGFNKRVNSLIHALNSLDIKKGDVIGILSWNRLEYADIYGTAMKGGFIISPFNPRLSDEELEFLFNYSEAKVLFLDPEFLPIVKKLQNKINGIEHFISFGDSGSGMISYDEVLAENSSNEPDLNVNEDDPFLIFFTSGTTGFPRGALYTHKRKLYNTRLKALELGAKPEDKHFMVLPFFHIGGDSHVWPFFLVGGSNVIIPQKSFDPTEVLLTIQEEKVTDMQIVPTQLNAILSHKDLKKYDLSSLKRIYYAASPMPVELLRKGLETFGTIFSQGYGQTESGPQITALPRSAHQVLDKPKDEQKVLKSCGQPSLGVHVRVVDDDDNDVEPDIIGEIILQSPSIMVEYWKKPKETDEAIINGWLHTGDLGYYDENGFIYIVDRKKDMIVTGGENVYSIEVENILYKHPAISEATVIGIPDPVWVESVHALVVIKEGSQTTEDEIINFCKDHLARYKAPKSVEFLESLPKNPQGKILKKEIRKRYWNDK
jgi:acyl-CoA synthetase (AMP-forming)/AMP-acid ligase II